MPFSTQLEAKHFLADKIASEAACQGRPLSDLEKNLLLFSGQEPGSVTGLPDDVLEGIDVEYEKRITNLLKAAYKRDSDNPQEKERYKQAMQVLNGGDHYLLVMANAAFAQMHTVRDLLLYVVIGLVVVAASIAYAMLR
jgi:hypothetical protein